MIYLASPHSHPSAEVRERRYAAALRYAVHLLKRGELVFSPIAHSHHMGESLPMACRCYDFWRPMDEAVLSVCTAVHVLMLDGWTESVGVREEIVFAERRGMPVVYVKPV